MNIELAAGDLVEYIFSINKLEHMRLSMSTITAVEPRKRPTEAGTIEMTSIIIVVLLMHSIV